jgi:hypothetical protein
MSLVDAITLGTLAAAIGFGGYHYQQVHLPQFAMIQAEVLYDKCMRECHEVCTANEVPLATCKCGHCLKYIKGDA